MNCKPGDLAVVARMVEGMGEQEKATFRRIVGNIVRVRSLSVIGFWTIEDPIDISGMVWTDDKGNTFLRRSGLVTEIHDAMLTPVSGCDIDEKVSDEVAA